VALSTLKTWNPRIHWEATRDIKSSIKYCSDPEKRAPQGRIWSSGFSVAPDIPPYIIKPDQFYQWQTDLLQELAQEPHDRTIVWYCDEPGGSGKTALSKYILATVPSCLFFSGGNFRDISHAVIKSSYDPTVIIMNLPRSSEGKISYGAIESMKDGLIQSGKYEGGTRMYKPPHVIIMANFMPELSQLSLDRWQIRHIADGEYRRE